jgi:hypothetical protein
LLIVITATLTPFSLRHYPGPSWLLEIRLADIAANFFLFLPFGAALRRLRMPWILMIAAAFSLGLELAQGWLPRHPSVTDIFVNAAGAWAGAVIVRRTPSPVISWHRWLPLMAILALSLTLLARTMVRGNALSDWELFPLLIGDEATGDRPWEGTIREIRVYDRAVFDAEEEGRAPAPWHEGGPILWLRFEGTASGRIDGPEGPEEVLLPRPPESEVDPAIQGLRVAGEGFSLPEGIARHLLERLSGSKELTITAHIRPASLSVTGPARIFSFSQDPFIRNFTLGQAGADLVFRVRTPATGPNGQPEVGTLDEPLTGNWQRARVVYDGNTSFIFLDGRCHRELPVALHRAPLLLGWFLGGTVVVCTALGALGTAYLVRKRQNRLFRLTAYCAGGTAFWSALWLAGAWNHLESFEGPAVVIGALALLTAIRTRPVLP